VIAMTKLVGAVSVSAALIFAPVLVPAQEASEWESQPAPAPVPPEQVPPAPPAEPPPPPQAQTAPPQVEQAPAPQAQAVPPGQWVYTQQYGWIWMPYADAYTSVPAYGIQIQPYCCV
jgi:hypothetical protein